MHISAPFIRRPVATALLSLAILMAGGVAFYFLPVAALPRVDFPTIYVRGGLPGASPETMASAVATPLERQFGRIAGITEMTSSSQLGSTGITLQFDLDRDINAASRDVQAAINAAAGQLPANLPSLPTYRRVNPSDPDIMDLSVFSDTIPRSRLYDLCDSILGQKLSQVDGVGQVGISGGAKPAVRVDLNPNALAHYGIGLEEVRAALREANANTPKGHLEDQGNRWILFATDQLLKPEQYVPLIIRGNRGYSQFGLRQWQALRQHIDCPAAGRQYHQDRGPHQGNLARIESLHSARRFPGNYFGPHDHDSRFRA